MYDEKWDIYIVLILIRRRHHDLLISKTLLQISLTEQKFRKIITRKPVFQYTIFRLSIWIKIKKCFLKHQLRKKYSHIDGQMDVHLYRVEHSWHLAC